MNSIQSLNSCCYSNDENVYKNLVIVSGGHGGGGGGHGGGHGGHGGE